MTERDPRSPKLNARLEWKGRKLLIKSVPVAHLWMDSNLEWRASVGAVELSSSGPFSTFEQARRAVNRRFGLPAG